MSGRRFSHGHVLGMRAFKRLNEPCKRLLNVLMNMAACVPWHPSRSESFGTQ